MLGPYDPESEDVNIDLRNAESTNRDTGLPGLGHTPNRETRSSRASANDSH